MTEWYSEYLDDLEMAETLRERVDHFYRIYTKFCPEKITDIFITDLITDEGLREYESLWFFSDSYVMEALRFISEDTFDMAVYGNGIQRWELRKQDYDLEEAGKGSRLHLEFRMGGDVRGILKAARENCDHLRDVFAKHILPNMKPDRRSTASS